MRPTIENAVNFIEESYIPQGSLCLILNEARPTKSGWWRKVKESECKSKYGNVETLYVLEKPIHKDFDSEDPLIAKTHKEQGLFVMNKTSLKNGLKDGKYRMLCCIWGTDSVLLSASKYSLGALDCFRGNIKYTNDFVDFYNLVIFGNTKSLVEEVANNYQVWR